MSLAIDEQLLQVQRPARSLSVEPIRLLRRGLLRLGGLLATGALALFVAIRVQLALLAYQVSQNAPQDWLAVAGGLAAGGLVLTLGCLLFLRPRSVRMIGGLVFFLPMWMLLIGGLATSFFPPNNFKSSSLQAEWSQLHPTLRQALWVARLSDHRIVLTDLTRLPADYHLMGLRLPFTSRHYPQTNGYAHAVDLRVSDAGDLRNWARQGLFLLMGLRADRHGGTGDHLHISMPQAMARS